MEALSSQHVLSLFFPSVCFDCLARWHAANPAWAKGKGLQEGQLVPSPFFSHVLFCCSLLGERQRRENSGRRVSWRFGPAVYPKNSHRAFTSVCACPCSTWPCRSSHSQVPFIFPSAPAGLALCPRTLTQVEAGKPACWDSPCGCTPSPETSM